MLNFVTLNNYYLPPSDKGNISKGKWLNPQSGIFLSLRSETADLRMPTGNWQYEP